MNPKRILVVGAGHVGLYAALRLSKKLSSREAEVMVVDPQPHMTYQPFLPEAAAGNISPRHSVVPLRRELRRCKMVAGTVTRIEHGRKVATVQPISGPAREITYDHVIVAPGSVSRTLPIPGLHEQGIGFKTIGEAIYLRNHVLDRLDVAAATPDPDVRRAALTFTFVGGGYAGIEALAEMEDMARDALRYYPELKQDEVRWVLVEATQRVLPEVDRDMGAYTVQQLMKRNMDIRLDTRLESCVDGVVKLSDGDSFRSDTIVWTAGVKPSPMLDSTDFPRDDRRRITCLPTLQVVDGDQVVEGAWSAGDCAAVPDLTKEPGNFCSPSAQHAVRQAARMADNITAVIRGREPVNYKHKHVGSVASLGLHKGVAQVYGIKMTGWPAWVMHRTYHMSRIPSFNRKVRVVVDWSLAFFLKREVVALGQLHDPREEFVEASQPVGAPRV
ncbi:NAD(P)/FAD-dependent oxidoreductase [Micromonospora zamorensis]|uniref:NAD(P)/FAD-dependent oxidoreductase n=1 Tax=Micromonospora TaxID=1873 RepID=UPI00081FB717|nr:MULTISPECIES: NAD(P)/FAD-dependent oxidoreductase [Micromonospora]MBQ0976536.1 NAD(P)/FAD-dependent oxidoreductase [Micromonospora sp. M61]MBQ1038000.1 NAD(P)/FAD-dependent oxidoreductase [Micromonospora sp. C81]TQJ20410.1 NADH dehydrogenase [Micromonospora sp. A202]WTE84736.1 NAD(P)/FAD-dependent oxidoreductase [Micromonospora zamorensis]WTI19523.1 NAD(P)/FAD-dependent oxidoreductase [Micromonospora zamorensis]